MSIKLNRWGSRKAADLTDLGLDHRRDGLVESPKPEGFVDSTDLLSGGIFILLRRGVVVHIGKSTEAILPKIAAMRASGRPKFLPRVLFDQVLIRRVHPDKLESLYLELVTTYLTKPIPRPEISSSTFRRI